MYGRFAPDNYTIDYFVSSSRICCHSDISHVSSCDSRKNIDNQVHNFCRRRLFDFINRNLSSDRYAKI